LTWSHSLLVSAAVGYARKTGLNFRKALNPSRRQHKGGFCGKPVPSSSAEPDCASFGIIALSDQSLLSHRMLASLTLIMRETPLSAFRRMMDDRFSINVYPRGQLVMTAWI
jgi:hypothetical protein